VQRRSRAGDNFLVGFGRAHHLHRQRRWIHGRGNNRRRVGTAAEVRRRTGRPLSWPSRFKSSKLALWYIWSLGLNSPAKWSPDDGPLMK
jgi:hypothetical protein